ncbi:hypothetical protein [Novosphingobium sp. FKTRR1]|uniref:hypothetical protein n=1 Tax=Novosphingobium sp. FKTRR1 TaxID=2879118 RepID=UPI001CEFC109|nr:hypothetical protein [Novosphingobium sp. FKTRR1]
MRSLLLVPALCALTLSADGVAQTVIAPKNVTAGEVVTQPLAVINVKKHDIPQVLVSAQANPYSGSGLRSCPTIAAKVRELDAALGDDFDVASEKSLAEKRGNTVGSLAKSVTGSLIPFGGIIREVSGANASERQWQVALYAGSVRRAFLKGIGQQRGCAYPARTATARDVAAVERTRAATRHNKSASKD